MTRRRDLALATIVQRQQEEREARVLHQKFPCCGVASRHVLNVGDVRDITCSRCGKRWTVTVTASTDRGAEMAGRPLAIARWRHTDAVVNADEAGASDPDLVKERGANSPQNGV